MRRYEGLDWYEGLVQRPLCLYLLKKGQIRSAPGMGVASPTGPIAKELGISAWTWVAEWL
jgi:hypothetical protein